MALRTAFALSVLLSMIKLVAYASSASTIVLASFFDSLTDAIVSYLNYYFFAKARENADADHPFGHGGFEVISSLIQGILIATLALVLVYQTLQALIWGSARQVVIEQLPLSVGIMLFSALAGFGIQILLARYQQQLQANKQSSLAVAADRAHYLGDFWTNALGALGLLTVWYLENPIWDQLLGLVGAGILLKTAIPLIQNCLRHIMQSGVAPELQVKMMELILRSSPSIVGVHRLRTRHYGPTLYVDFHLKLPAQMTLQAAHAQGELATARIKEQFPNADVLVHIDPDNYPDEA